ncbi:glutathione synthase [Candidatus Thioglobus sp.]|uniref:glutathione synthase n=1 Tax=Candidatus Thioglobus sp. TaxID=2026721 RepID=UPI003D112B1C
MKPIKIAVLMDDIKNIKPHKDSSLAMMLEATRRNWEIYTFDASDLFAQEGEVLATCARTYVFDDAQHWYEKEPKTDLTLNSFDVILMRKDPPFDMNYIYATYFLEQAESKGTLVVNKPQSLRDANEKLFALNFPHCLPKTLVSSNRNQLNRFIKTQGVSVVKPLDGMGGKDIFKLQQGDDNVNEVLDYLTHQGNTPIMAQEFLPEIAQGDKRILLINGKPIDYALARLPAAGSFKGNLAAGAVGVGQPLSARDRYLCEQIAPTLKAKGLMFVGLDVIGDYITEINVTSPTCIRELDAQFDLNIAGTLFDAIELALS